jgi:carotenoid cleavage dioxygenase-like enzyme
MSVTWAHQAWLVPILSCSGYGFTHDMGVTKNYFVVWQGPVATDQLAYVTGQVRINSMRLQAIQWHEGGSSGATNNCAITSIFLPCNACQQVCAASSVRWKPGAPTYVWVIPRPGSEAER